MAAVDTGPDATIDEFLGESPRRAGGTRSQDLRPPPGLAMPGEVVPADAWWEPFRGRAACSPGGDVPVPRNEPVETTTAGDLGWNEPDPFPPLRQDFPDRPTWRCLQCDSDAWEERERALWVCLRCGSTQFYDSTTPTRREAARGVWMYMPHRLQDEPSATTTSESTASLSTAPRPWSPTPPSPLHRQRRPPSEPSAGEWDEARAESEAPTYDGSIDPETLRPLPRLSRRQRRAAAAAAPGARLQEPRSPQVRRAVLPEPPGVPREDDPRRDGWRDQMLHDLGDLRLQQKPSSEWNSRKGPEKGIKFRGGAPPAPPAWHYNKDDLRAYDRWERKVRVWQLQVASYLPDNEAAMALFVSLKGEAEDELETADLKRINSKDGVDFILDTLRSALKTRAIYQKRKYIHDFEHLSRFNNESVRSFCNRYHRVERALLSCGVDIAPMYDSEARGARLLERLRLTSEQQRMILIGTNQALHFDAVKEAAQLQFPEHRPIPPVVFTREFDGGKQAQHERLQDKGQPKGAGKTKGKPKGKGNKGYSAYVADHAEELGGEDYENLDGIPEDGEEVEDDGDANPVDPEEEELLADGDETNDNDEIAQAIMEAAGVLTVTARRLQGVRLGRKFTGGKATIEERKKRSNCSACGRQGHWAGDAECPVSKSSVGKGPPKGVAKAAPKAGKPVSGSSKVMIVRSEGTPSTHEAGAEDPDHEKEYGSYFTTFVCAALPVAHNVSEVLITKPADFAGYAVLDTACQETVCSGSWLQGQQKLLRQHKMIVKTKPEKEGFQFGFGPVQFSSEHAYVPVSLDNSVSTCCLFGTSVLHENCEIPLLLSLSMIERKLQAVLDFPKGCAYFGAFGIEVPIVKINGHLCISIANFPGDRSPWKVLSRVLDQGDPDLELVRQPLEPNTTTVLHGNEPASASMADCLAPHGNLPHEGRDDAGEVHDADREAWVAATLVDSSLRSGASGLHNSDPGTDGGTVLPSYGVDGKDREPARKFFPVHSVRDAVAMGPRGVGRAAILAAAAASAALGNFLGATAVGSAAGARLRVYDPAGDFGEDTLRPWSQGHASRHQDFPRWRDA